MSFIFRAIIFFCAVLFSTASLYCFTAFWSGIGSQIKNEKTMVEVSQQTFIPISSIKRTEEEHSSDNTA